MKLISTVILFFSISLLKAQTNPATPNANFENWTHYTTGGGYDDPNNWNSLNPTTIALGFTTCYKNSTTVLSGSYSVQLVTMTFVGQLIPGTITTGSINTTTQTISGGIPYILRPDSITGWFQYTPASGDNGDIEFYLFGANHLDTIGQAFFKTPTTTVSSWTRFSLAITYTSTATPDTALWIITSSDNQNTGHAGSELYVDSIGLAFTTTGVNTITGHDNLIVGPTLTNGNFSVTNNSGSQSLVFNLTDIAGRKVEKEKIGSGVTFMELAGLAEGIYIYSVQDESDGIIKSGKIVIQK